MKIKHHMATLELYNLNKNACLKIYYLLNTIDNKQIMKLMK